VSEYLPQSKKVKEIQTAIDYIDIWLPNAWRQYRKTKDELKKLKKLINREEHR